jgi:hypothetical protein
MVDLSVGTFTAHPQLIKVVKKRQIKLLTMRDQAKVLFAVDYVYTDEKIIKFFYLFHTLYVSLNKAISQNKLSNDTNKKYKLESSQKTSIYFGLYLFLSIYLIIELLCTINSLIINKISILLCNDKW